MEDLKDKGKGGRKAIPLFQSLVYIFVFFTPLYLNEKVSYPFVFGALDIMKGLGFNCAENPKGDFIGVMCIWLKY
jgi:hypothetical protein